MTIILNSLHSQISALELIQNIYKNNPIWIKRNDISFYCTFNTNSGIFELSITKNPRNQLINIDVTLDGVYYLSLNSVEEPNLNFLYEDMIEDISYNKDREILKELSQL